MGAVFAIGYAQLYLGDNAREVGDAADTLETDAEYATKVTVNTATFAAFNRLGEVVGRPLVSKAIHPSFPRVGRPPMFPNPAYWAGTRAQIAYGNAAAELFLFNPTQQSFNSWILAYLERGYIK